MYKHTQIEYLVILLSDVMEADPKLQILKQIIFVHYRIFLRFAKQI